MQFVSWSNLTDCLNVIVKRCGAYFRPFSSPANEPCSCCENDLQSPSVSALVEGICKAIGIPRSPLIPESMRARRYNRLPTMKQQLACLVAPSSQESRRINYPCHIAHLYLPFGIQSSSALPSNTLTELVKTHLPTFHPTTSDSGDRAAPTQRRSPNHSREFLNLPALSLLSIRHLFETPVTTTPRSKDVAQVREQLKGP